MQNIIGLLQLLRAAQLLKQGAQVCANAQTFQMGFPAGLCWLQPRYSLILMLLMACMCLSVTASAFLWAALALAVRPCSIAAAAASSASCSRTIFSYWAAISTEAAWNKASTCACSNVAGTLGAGLQQNLCSESRACTRIAD